MNDPLDSTITVTKQISGWRFYCKVCTLWSGGRATESRAAKEARVHVTNKGHNVLVEKARINSERTRPSEGGR